MPWSTPTLKEVRSLVRDSIRGSLPGADASVPNSVLRVLSDAQGALCHLTLQYVDWLALQLLPDTAETEWLDRHGDIWLVNADGSTGRKMATFATGTADLVGFNGTTVPIGTQFEGSSNLATAAVGYETTAEVVLGGGPTPAPIRALDPGTIGNLEIGTALTPTTAVPGLSGATVTSLYGGTETESDEDLRARVLKRIQNPPMGGAAHDYELWALAVPGVTRAWCAPLEMGIGTVTVRFLMDELRAYNDGWPEAEDIAAVKAYLDTKRPVAVKDNFVVAPIKQFIDVDLTELVPDTEETKAEIEANIREMLRTAAAPGQTIYAAWVSYAIMSAPSVVSFRLVSCDDYPMQSPGHMAVLRTIHYV